MGFGMAPRPMPPWLRRVRRQRTPARLVLNRKEVLQTLHDAGGLPTGHGLTQAEVDAEVGWFSTHPVAGRPIRLIVLDTVNSWSGAGISAEGTLDEAQFAWLTAELAAADDDDEVVVVMSHHKAADIHPASPVSGDDLTALLAASDGVVLHVTGHGHKNEKRQLGDLDPVSADFGYWELMVASTVDFPMHTRIIELVDEGTGFLTVYVTQRGPQQPGGQPCPSRSCAGGGEAGVREDPFCSGCRWLLGRRHRRTEPGAADRGVGRRTG